MKLQFRVLISLLIMPGIAVQAADWKSSKKVTTTVTHSDNTALATNANSQSDTVLQVRPSLGITGKGARMDLSFNYSLGAVFSNGDNNRDELQDSHFLNTSAKIEAIEDNLFIDINANAGVTSVSSNAVVASDINTQSGNTTQTYSLAISPYFKYHFGSFADATIRYSSDALTSQSNANDSENSNWNLSLNSGRRFYAYNWAVSASQSEVSYDNNQSDERSSIKTDFQFRINRFFTADFGLGYEENDYQNAIIAYANNDGMIWDVGTTWTPNPRTSMKVSYGDRSTGEDWAMDLKYRHRKSTLTASYGTTVTNSRTEQINTISSTSTDINGETVFIGDKDLLLDPILPSLGTENIVQSQFKLAYQYSARRTSVGFDTAFSERDYSNGSTESLSTSLNMSRKLTPLTSLTGRVSWTAQDDVSTVASDQETISYNIGVNTSLGAKSRLSVDYQHSENDLAGGTGLGGNDYEEDRISASLAMTF